MQSPKSRVRIGAGQWRSRVLRFPDVPGLRPTPDRVREPLFNWLGQNLEGLSCLDLFSGTGVLGFEAISRGAAQAVMVEQALPVYQSLLENKKLLNADTAEIIRADSMQFLAANRQRFDVIFLDPPFNQGWLSRLLPSMHEHLAADGALYVEAEFTLQDGDGWQVMKHGKAGNVFFHLLKSMDADE